MAKKLDFIEFFKTPNHYLIKLLSNKASIVKEVVNLLGYENASKFAAAFLRTHWRFTINNSKRKSCLNYLSTSYSLYKIIPERKLF